MENDANTFYKCLVSFINDHMLLPNESRSQPSARVAWQNYCLQYFVLILCSPPSIRLISNLVLCPHLMFPSSLAHSHQYIAHTRGQPHPLIPCPQPLKFRIVHVESGSLQHLVEFRLHYASWPSGVHLREHVCQVQESGLKWNKYCKQYTTLSAPTATRGLANI